MDARGTLLVVTLATTSAVGSAGCSDAAPPARTAPAWSGAAPGDATARSGLPVETWFPLVDGNLYQYRTTAGEGAGEGEGGLLVARAHRSSGRVGELRMPSGTRRFEYRNDGLATLNKDGVWTLVLKLPVELPAAGGPTWRGEHGGQARWDAKDLAVKVTAGSFEGCARVLEERGGDRPARFATTFCPGTGIVLLEAASGAAVERAELAYVGPPLDLGPDGTKRVP